MSTQSKNPKPERFRISTDEREIIKKIEILTRSVERVYPRIAVLMWRSFVQGIFVALGSTVGLAIVITVFTFFLHQLRFIPVVSDFLELINIPRYLPKQ
jgi:hypothetical protein